MFVKKLTAVVLTGLMTITSFVPVQAQEVTLSFGQRQHVVRSYCEQYPRDYDCRGYYDGRWSDRDYDSFYYKNRHDLDSLAAGIFGLAIGAMIAGAIANSNNNRGGSSNAEIIGRVDRGKVARCSARYKSYDQRSNSFLGYDGIRHQCNL